MAKRLISQGDGDGPTQLIDDGAGGSLLIRRTARLRVASGPDVGRSVELGDARATVGSSASNSLVLADAGVSRVHFEIQVRDRGFLLRDLGSTNGTFYRGARVHEALLDLGAEIRLASTVLRLEAGEERSDAVGPRRSFGNLVGSSPAMQKLYGALAAVAPTDLTVLIEGETGTGKELVADELHNQSPRREHPLSVVDCGSLPATLIESELFGHARGAFTGAVATRAGVFERTRGGTVFLDEIGELPLELQTRLLRVLDQRTVKRLGEDTRRHVDVRLVAATNRDLAEEVEQGRFRQDLFYRLSVVRVRVPPLRRRGDDVMLLARHFLWQAGAPDPDAVLDEALLAVLRGRRWPGNVRELRNVVERAIALGGGEGPELVGGAELDDAEAFDAEASATAQRLEREQRWLEHLPASFYDGDLKTSRESIVTAFEQRYLERLIERHGQNVSAIARDAGVDRHQVRRLLRKHGLYQ